MNANISVSFLKPCKNSICSPKNVVSFWVLAPDLHQGLFPLATTGPSDPHSCPSILSVLSPPMPDKHTHIGPTATWTTKVVGHYTFPTNKNILFFWRSFYGDAVVQRVRHLGLRSVGRGFKSCSRQRCVTTLGKLFKPMCLCHQAV